MTLWKTINNVPYLVNPYLGILSNPKKRRIKKMAKKKRKTSGIRLMRAKNGRFIKRSRTVRRAKKNTAKRSVVIMKTAPVKRRKTTRRRNAISLSPVRRRVYRRNPPGDFKSIFSKDTLEKVGYSALGIWGVPVVAGAVQRVMPLSVMTVIDSNPSLRYVLKGVSALGMYWAASKFISRKAGEFVLVGGLAYLGLSIVNDLAPAAINPFGMGRYLAKQPLLAGSRGVGRYLSPKPGNMRGVITNSTASRLNPARTF
jgi:hypothetical protein